jgi:hypothetical protein
MRVSAWSASRFDISSCCRSSLMRSCSFSRRCTAAYAGTHRTRSHAGSATLEPRMGHASCSILRCAMSVSLACLSVRLRSSSGRADPSSRASPSCPALGAALSTRVCRTFARVASSDLRSSSCHDLLAQAHPPTWTTCRSTTAANGICNYGSANGCTIAIRCSKQWMNVTRVLLVRVRWQMTLSVAQSLVLSLHRRTIGNPICSLLPLMRDCTQLSFALALADGRGTIRQEARAVQCPRAAPERTVRSGWARTGRI